MMAPPKSQNPPARISAPSASIVRREHPKEVVREVAPVAAAPPPPPPPAPVAKDLLEEDDEPQNNFDINRLSDLKFETPAMAAEPAPGLMPSRPQDLLN